MVINKASTVAATSEGLDRILIQWKVYLDDGMGQDETVHCKILYIILISSSGNWFSCLWIPF